MPPKIDIQGLYYYSIGNESYCLFSKEKCDRCQCEIQGPNSFTIFTSKSLNLEKGGAIKSDTYPCEGNFLESIEEVVCDSCL